VHKNILCGDKFLGAHGGGQLAQAPPALGLDAVEQVLTLAAHAAVGAGRVALKRLVGQVLPTFATRHHLTR